MQRCLALLAAGCAVSALFPQMAFAQAGSCDAVLIQQVDYSNSDERVGLSWLSIINESNYEQAKHDAAGQAYADMFSGSYSDFSERRRTMQQESGYSYNASSAREILKTSLNDAQTAAWAQCMGARTSLYITYQDVAPDAATIVVNWSAPSTVGPLRITSIDAPDTRGAFLSPGDTLTGQSTFIVRRAQPATTIRGAVNGVAGVNNTGFSASYFIPEWTPPRPPTVVEPIKTVLSTDGTRLKSIAYWSERRSHSEFSCASETPANMLRFDLEVSRSEHGRRRTCNVDASYCDSAGEECDEYTVTRGCFVNTEWWEWYVARSRRSGTPVIEAAACAPQTSRSRS